MFNMVNDLFDFINWVQTAMNAKDITNADIARTGFVKPAAVSMFFSFKTKSVGIDMCKAISAATDIPLVTVYRKAGLLPNVTLTETEAEEIAALMSEITDPDLRQDAHEQLALLKQKQARRKNNGHTLSGNGLHDAPS